MNADNLRAKLASQAEVRINAKLRRAAAREVDRARKILHDAAALLRTVAPEEATELTRIAETLPQPQQ